MWLLTTDVTELRPLSLHQHCSAKRTSFFLSDFAMFITAQATTPGLSLFWQLHRLAPSSCFLLFLISLAPAFITTELGGTQATCYL